MNHLDKRYWSDRYESGQTGWDIGYPSPPLTQYLDQIENKTLKILIPGAGNAYEAEYAFQKGFKNIYVVDISSEPLKNFKMKNPQFPEEHLIEGDFFDLEDNFDLVLEQTFFCALDPELRGNYVRKMHKLLNPSGRLVGVLFNRNFPFVGPPFGGNQVEFRRIFDPYFEGIMEPCRNSIPERQGAELWIGLGPK